MVYTFLINLDRDTKRLVRMTEQARQAGLSFERVPAVLGNAVPEHFRSQFEGSPLLPGEIGCYASHLVIAETILARGLPYALVFEDDVDIAADAVSAIAELLPRRERLGSGQTVQRPAGEVRPSRE